MSALRFVNRRLSPGGERGSLTIMIFHRVLPEPDALMPLEPDAATFAKRMARVREWFNVVPLDEAVTSLQGRSLPERALAVTFDDGYADNHDVAFPILRELGIPATFFVATAYLDGGCMWNDQIIEALRHHDGDVLDLGDIGLGRTSTGSAIERVAAIERILGALKYRPPPERAAIAGEIARRTAATERADLMMTRAQVRGLARGGMTIGAHTATHPILAHLDAAEARREIATGKQDLEAITDRPVTLFAYPNGKPNKDYTIANVEQVRELGFLAACSTAPGVAAPGDDLLQLPRFSPWDRPIWRYGVRLSRNLRNHNFATA
jgi:peptidoglycan/xylan/chitin deacetylase (PgdA/CDA1 family)